MIKNNNIIIDGVKYKLVRQKESESFYGLCGGCSLNIINCIENKNVKCTNDTVYKKVSELRKDKIKQILK
jgi:hypothetical protein